MSQDRISLSDLIKKGFVYDPATGEWGKSSSKAPKQRVPPLKEAGGASKSGTYTFDITPMGKPSYQKSDKFRTLNHPNPKLRQRNVVTKWINFKKEISAQATKQGFIIPDCGASIKFILPMPDSWSKKKKTEMDGKPHKQKPDLDNNLKGFFDSVCEEDSYIWQYMPEKRWGKTGKIIVTI
jgi:Holliday junction resolvase RusA-like endonuclease